MAKRPKSDDEYTDEEARERFEKAVDAALQTPPMHRKPNEKAAKKQSANPRARRRKDHRLPK